MTEDHRKLHEAASKFVAVAMTCKKRNQPEWMLFFAEQINAMLTALRTDDRVKYPGKWSNEFHLESGS